MTKREKENKINKALEEIRPFLQRDGGDISLVKMKNDEIIVKFEGNCLHCKINNLTLQVGVKNIIQKHLPDIKKIKHLT